MKMDGLYPAVFSHPVNFTSIAWFKASVSTHPPLMPDAKYGALKDRDEYRAESTYAASRRIYIGESITEIFRIQFL